jgi:hypothetical protein
MGCGCDKRADWLLRQADEHDVRLAAKLRAYLERTARRVNRTSVETTPAATGDNAEGRAYA